MQSFADFFGKCQSRSRSFRADLVEPSREGQASDLALACFSLADQTQDAATVAQTISRDLQGLPEIERVWAENGYVNIRFKTAYIVEVLLANPKPNLAPVEDPRPVIIDYFGVNIAKQPTAGHLRNLVLGRSLVNLYRLFGYDVITDNHIGDWGTVFGLWVIGYERFSSPQKLESGGLEELGRVYRLIVAEYEAAIKSRPETGPASAIETDVQDWLLRLQASDPVAVAYHKQFCDLSLGEVEPLLEIFKIKFDFVLGESFYQDQATALIDDLIKCQIAVREPNGAVVVDLTSIDRSLGSLVVRKSNNANLYISSDMAALKYRQDKWRPQRIIYVVGAEQSFHFRQLFGLNQIVDYCQADLVHYAYGLIEVRRPDGQRRKMSSRSESVTLAEIWQRAMATTADLVKPTVSLADRQKIAVAALTFLEFQQARLTNSLFDWDRAFNLKARSGPYIQYAAVRLKSLLAKTSPGQSKPTLPETEYDYQSERALLWRLGQYEAVLHRSWAEQSLNPVANHVWLLGRDFNRYYEQTPVKTAPEPIRDHRCWCLNLVLEQIQAALELLGIDIPDSM